MTKSPQPQRLQHALCPHYAGHDAMVLAGGKRARDAHDGADDDTADGGAFEKRRCGVDPRLDPQSIAVAHTTGPLAWGPLPAGSPLLQGSPREILAKLRADLHVPEDSPAPFVLAWKMHAASATNGGEGPSGASLDRLLKLGSRAHISEALARELDSLDTRRRVFRFAFDFLKSKHSRYMDAADAAYLIAVLLRGNRHAEQFVAFLRTASPVKVMNRDQWGSFFEFSISIREDLANFDINGAWPSLIDEYVSWCQTTLQAHPARGW